MIKIKRNFEEMKKRNLSFVNREKVDRPLFGAYILGRDYMKLHEKAYKNIPKNREVKSDDIVINDYLEDLEKRINMTEEVGKDLFCPISPWTDIPWMEAIAGCPVFAGRDSLYTQPFIKTWDDFVEKIDLSSNNEWLSKLIKLEEAILKNFGSIYPISITTVLRGPADMVSAALGQNRFALELFDNPEKIKILSEIYTNAFIEVAKKLNKIVSKANYVGYTVNLFGVWTPEVCQYYQDDALAIMSPGFYRDFILEKHLKIDKSFPSTCYHVHPVSLFIIDELIKFPNLKIIEVNREPMGPSVSELLPAFKKIQNSNKALIIDFTYIDFTPDLIKEEVQFAFDYLSSNGLCIYICVADVEDGLLKTEAVNKVFDI